MPLAEVGQAMVGQVWGTLVRLVTLGFLIDVEFEQVVGSSSLGFRRKMCAE